MNNFLQNLKNINNIDDAIKSLEQSIVLNDKIKSAIDFCIKAHENQSRKSGEPYAVHPILVASVTAYYSKDEAMVLASLLHDVVEDTEYSVEYINDNYGSDVAHIVDGLTKITEIREHELISANDKLMQSALTFRKMIIASTDDVRVLVVKLFDRTHNMLTLNSLNNDKQKRISEETLLVYAPIAHRLGMSSIKNILEDLSFYYLYPNEYAKIHMHIKTHQEKVQLTFDKFVQNMNTLLNTNKTNNIQISSRIKHYYSIYLKTQRKGVNIDEVLDLFAIRIITNNDLECYNVLGKIHTSYRPLIARFKDYIAVPKENGYQTIHTTVFNEAKIFEIQIRTKDMHDVAEFGVAAHWKYKSGTSSKAKPKLDWLHTLETSNDDIEEFYVDTKQDLFSEEIIVYSPKGDIFTLPRDSTAYDFAYLIHSDVGNKADECYINNVKKPLLTQLRSGDIVAIKMSNEVIARCSWIDIVKTTKAKKNIKLICHNKIKIIDNLNSVNIINTIFAKYKSNILNTINIDKIEKLPYSYDNLKNIKYKIEDILKNTDGFMARFKLLNTNLKEYIFDNIILYSNSSVKTVSFDHCCHPKLGDDIVAFKKKKDVIIHHKMCDTSFELMKNNNSMVFIQWDLDKYYTYKMVLSILHIKGELSRLLSHLLSNDAIIHSVDFRRDQSSNVQYCKLDLQIKNPNIQAVKKIVSKKAKVIEFYSSSDAYK